ncbi:MAG: Uma2 family endonuclease [Synechococcaceae cyanobacterium SM2_3_1]|nr:Uma2 family endonuclease [Synechococcaceae cyanobacterium SM2_3_1]
MANLLPVSDLVVSQPMTLEAFLEFDDGTDAFYELEDGELRLMPTESEINVLIASFLFASFLQAGVLFACLRMKTEVVVSGRRATVRIPDLMVLSKEVIGYSLLRDLNSTD